MSESSVKERLFQLGEKAAQRYMQVVLSWQETFAQCETGTTDQPSLQQTLSFELCTAIGWMSSPYKGRPSEALAELALPVLQRLNSETFGNMEPWELQDFCNDNEDTNLELALLSTRIFLLSSEIVAAKDCISALADFISTYQPHARSGEERRRVAKLLTVLSEIQDGMVESDKDGHEDCELLGLSETYTDTDLRTAYREKVRAWHPDRLNDMAPELKALANERLGQINAAYERLANRRQASPTASGGEYARNASTSGIQKRSEVDVREHAVFNEGRYDSHFEPEPTYQRASGHSSRTIHGIAIACCVVAVVAAFLLTPDRSFHSAYADIQPASRGVTSSNPGDAKSDDGSHYVAHHPIPARTPVSTDVYGDADSAVTSDVLAELGRWSEAMTSNDANQIMSHYAPVMQRYFLKKDVDHSLVEASIEKWLADGNRMTAFIVQHPRVDATVSGEVRVRFVKAIDISSPTGPQQVFIPSELELINESGAWRIISERDFKL